MTRVLIVDDQEVVLEGLRVALARYSDVEIVGQASDGREALKQVESLSPHIIIMEVAMPVFNGIEAAIQIKNLYPKIKIIIFTMHAHQKFLTPLIRAGISGYVMKNQPLEDLHLAIRAVRAGGTFFSEDIENFLANFGEKLLDKEVGKDPFSLLTLRERQVFQMIAVGQTVRQIARLLDIRPQTVQTHKYHIMYKLELRSMTEWTKEAVRQGIIQI